MGGPSECIETNARMRGRGTAVNPATPPRAIPASRRQTPERLFGVIPAKAAPRNIIRAAGRPFARGMTMSGGFYGFFSVNTGLGFKRTCRRLPPPSRSGTSPKGVWPIPTPSANLCNEFKLNCGLENDKARMPRVLIRVGLKGGEMRYVTAGQSPRRPAIVFVSPAEHRRVVFASSLGTVFEWYDFYLYATLAPFFASLFFPPGNDTARCFRRLLPMPPAF